MNYIYTEKTPNPDSMKFITGRDLTTGGTVEVRSMEEAIGKPLLEDLIMLPGVASAMVGRNFATVTKSSGDWDTLTSDVIRVLSGQFYQPIRVGSRAPVTDDPIVARINELLEERIRPAVARDGGDVAFHDFKDGVLTLEMMGSCNGCPSSMATLKGGIENMMRHFIPEVREVRSL